MTQFETILQKVNEQLKQIPLIYFSREVDRALGLEDYLENYHMCCIEDNFVVDKLQEKGKSVFCLQKQTGEVLERRSTAQLVSHPKTIEWLKTVTKKTNGKFFALTLYPSNVFKFKIESLGGTFLLINPELSANIENKILQLNLIKQIKGFEEFIPTSDIINLTEHKHNDFANKFGPNYVIQVQKSHTGGGSHRIHSEDDYESVKANLQGNDVKVTSFINGLPLTINICIGQSKCYIGSLQYQITGIEALTNSKTSTVGNDFSLGASLLNPTLTAKITKMATLLCDYLKNLGYMGLYGLDLILDGNNLYLIEINARQTLNIPFATELTLLTNAKQAPLLLLHIAELLGINTGLFATDFKNLLPLHGSQIFLRSLADGTVVKHEPKSGLYRLQSDNLASEELSGQSQDNVIYLDEEEK